MDNLLTNFVDKIKELTVDAKREPFVTREGVDYQLRHGEYSRMINDTPEAIMVSSLSAVQSWLESNENSDNEKFIIVIENEKEVFLFRSRDEYEKRACIIRCSAITSSFSFGHLKEQKRFVINVHSSFVASPEKSELIKTASRVKAETTVLNEDDGISQNVTISDGVRVKTDNTKALFKLAPYRTFSEVKQPESTYLFRVEKQGSEATCALFDSDDKTWKLEAIASIRKYLKENIKSDKVSIIG